MARSFVRLRIRRYTVRQMQGVSVTRSRSIAGAAVLSSDFAFARQPLSAGGRKG